MNKSQYKIDLHTHSIISHDGGIQAAEYEKLLSEKTLDCVAITDHNETRLARILHKEWGDRVIVGEEITTRDGEIIGLYLKETIDPGLSAAETVAHIKAQRGLVYIPHPFETFRKGIQRVVLEEIKTNVDIIETFNGRGKFRGKAAAAHAFSTEHTIVSAASSDAHCSRGMGYSYSLVESIPEKDTLKRLLSEGTLHKTYAPFYTYFCPFINKIKNKIVLTNTEL